MHTTNHKPHASITSAPSSQVSPQQTLQPPEQLQGRSPTALTTKQSPPPPRPPSLPGQTRHASMQQQQQQQQPYQRQERQERQQQQQQQQQQQPQQRQEYQERQQQQQQEACPNRDGAPSSTSISYPQGLGSRLAGAVSRFVRFDLSVLALLG